MIDFTQFDSLFALIQYFNNDDICKQTIIESRWGVGENQDAVCPYCGKHHCHRRKDGRFCCSRCKKNFSCTAGTIFDNTKISLVKWFIAMYLISSHKKGVSSHQLARDLKVTQKTAWHILHKVRSLMIQDDSVALQGTVECDEVYIGGKEKWKHKSMRTPGTQGRSTKTKTPVFGMVERTLILNEKTGESEPMSYVRAVVVKKTDRATLLPIIKQFVADGTHLITDELTSYNGLEREGYTHSIVCHNQEEYVRDGVFTNDMEGFWSHFRRMVLGIYHDVSDKYLQRYVDEACYRWNTRKASESERFSYMFRKSVGVFRYSDVTMTEKVA